MHFIKNLLKNLILIIGLSINAQQEDLSFVSLGGGYVQNGIGTALTYDRYISGDGYIEGELLFSFSKYKYQSLRTLNIPYNSIFVNGGYFHQVAQIDRDFITFNGGAGISFGYQIINNGKSELSDGALIIGDSKFVIGYYVGIDTRIFINYKWSVRLNYKQFHHINSDIGKFSPYGGIALMHNF